MSLAEVELLAAAFIALGLALYAVLRWRAAPAAFRAIVAVALLSFASGAVAALGIEELLSGVSLAPGLLGGSKVEALEVGKAIVLTNQQHSGENLWMPIAKVARECREAGPAPVFKETDVECRSAYLAMHALGKDLDRGPQEERMDLDEVAEICDFGAIDNDSALCRRAFAGRNARIRTK